MKKIKKIFTLSVTTLLMGGLVVCIPKNTKIVSAGVVHTKFTDEGAAATTRSISNRYSETFTLRTRHPKTGEKGKVTMLISRDRYGYLRMDIARLSPPGHEFDDDYTFVVFDRNLNLRFRFDTNYKCEKTVYKELDKLSNEFNDLQVGVGNYIGVIGRSWNGTVLFDTTEGFTALKRTGHNRFEKGYSDVNVKFSTLLRVTDDGLQEFTTKWIDRVWKKVTV